MTKEELENENKQLKMRIVYLMGLLKKSMDCETCKYYDEELEKDDKEPCRSCFFDNSKWELKEM